MSEELAILRRLAANPYDRGTLGVYADFLREQGREDEEAKVRRLLAAAKPANLDVNSTTVGELVGILLEMPPDAVVLYRACSDWNELGPDEVKLVRADEKKIIWRQQNGYTDYCAAWFTDADPRPYNKLKGEQPNFVTVCCFPGN